MKTKNPPRIDVIKPHPPNHAVLLRKRPHPLSPSIVFSRSNCFLQEEGVNLHGHHPHLTLWHCMFGYPAIFVSIIRMCLLTVEGCQIIFPIDDLSLTLRVELFLFRL
jgi:hypothetical protein